MINLAKFYRENKDKASIGLRAFTDRVKKGTFKTELEALTYKRKPTIKKNTLKEKIPVSAKKIVSTNKTSFYNENKTKYPDKVEISYKVFCNRTKNGMTFDDAIFSEGRY